MKMEKSVWKGYNRYDFKVNDRDALIIVPHTLAEGNPWVWRAEFFDAFPQADMALLERGWHLAYYNVSDMYGCPDAIHLMRAYQDFVEEKFKLAPKAILFGFSRGGLYAFNYAADYPDKVSALYLDAPVLDIKSWPGGFGEAPRSYKEWQESLKAYNLTEETVKNFKGNPLDKIDHVASYGIPIIVVYGEEDKAAIFSENAGILIRRYRELNCELKVIPKPGVGHHPHSLEDPSPIVDYLLARWNLKV